ncbi:DUF1127 domain-containing protein [Rhodopila sp.]|uniref:DUF1127 domain-containing protein n=1 Tax=Rhodopila sp. TaxID=2480087 RepID=UPI003D0FC2D4
MNLYSNISISSGSQRKFAGDAGTSISSFTQRLRRLAAYLSDRRERRRAADSLHSFSDRELWDVGLSRADILSIGQGTFRRDR